MKGSGPDSTSVNNIGSGWTITIQIFLTLIYSKVKQKMTSRQEAVQPQNLRLGKNERTQTLNADWLWWPGRQILQKIFCNEQLSQFWPFLEFKWKLGHIFGLFWLIFRPQNLLGAGIFSRLVQPKIAQLATVMLNFKKGDPLVNMIAFDSSPSHYFCWQSVFTWLQGGSKDDII